MAPLIRAVSTEDLVVADPLSPQSSVDMLRVLPDLHRTHKHVLSRAVHLVYVTLTVAVQERHVRELAPLLLFYRNYFSAPPEFSTIHGYIIEGITVLLVLYLALRVRITLGFVVTEMSLVYKGSAVVGVVLVV